MTARLRALALLAPAALALAACTSDGASPTLAPPEEAAANHVPPVCVEFNVPPVGTVFGAPVGQPPGTVAFVEAGVVVRTRPYNPGGGPVYNAATIIPSPAGFGVAPKAAHLKAISLEFDFAALPWVPSFVSFDWRENAGPSNLRVNAGGLFIGSFTAVPAGLGVSAWGWWAAGVPQGTTRVGGAPVRVLIGGRDLYLDRVCAHH
ncbi:MAG TPA: hypothetical protein VHG91_08250 [Longimicrobium sp.]|nr:hypothetical protein [Longimicrobium sp.]